MASINYFHWLLMIAALAGPWSVFAMECEWPDRNALASVLPVATDDGSYASGVVIAPNRVLTAAHAVGDAEHAFVRIDHDFIPAEVISVDIDKDLAVMIVDTGDINPIRLAPREPYVNEPVWAIGFPHALSRKTSAGNFQDKLDGALHTSASIDAGESGGGLISCYRGDFVLAGMLRGYGAYLQGDSYVRIENHSVSVAASDIQQFIPWSAQ
ncbi:MAG: trypsin-like peptidase domain-containing protein [Gammaproteobacteria bacterium]|nr:trypsin-like peptidase domain-containing protein [Gammaproteobacteria bacterium]